MTKDREIGLPPNNEDKEDGADEDEQPLRRLVKKLRDGKGKEKVIDFGLEVARSYSTRGSKKNILVQAMKARKSLTTKTRILKKVVIVEKEKNVKVVKVGEGGDINHDVAATTKKIKKNVHISGRTRSSSSKYYGPTEI
ncbi:hypothetical protein FXO37_04450 [Capsicum annuum]|nr:hypothetical protein FXO37_04450 [Capsicum annuum]